MTRTHGFLVGGLGVVAAALLHLMPADAAPARKASPAVEARCTVRIIHGLKKPGAFPADLKPLQSRLAGKPFQRFKSFKLLKTKVLPLATGRLTRKSLVGPYRFEGQLLARVIAAKGRKRLRFQLSLYRRRARMKAAKRLLHTKLVIDQGGTMFLAGPRYKCGRLIFALTCK